GRSPKREAPHQNAHDENVEAACAVGKHPDGDGGEPADDRERARQEADGFVADAELVLQSGRERPEGGTISRVEREHTCEREDDATVHSVTECGWRLVKGGRSGPIWSGTRRHPFGLPRLCP